MDIVGKIIKIGNSCGLIIPSSVMKDLSLSLGDQVLIGKNAHSIVITKQEPFTGPFTGFFADLPHPGPGEPDPWGDRDSAEIVEEMRSGRYDRQKDLEW